MYDPLIQPGGALAVDSMDVTRVFLDEHAVMLRVSNTQETYEDLRWEECETYDEALERLVYWVERIREGKEVADEIEEPSIDMNAAKEPPPGLDREFVRGGRAALRALAETGTIILRVQGKANGGGDRVLDPDSMMFWWDNTHQRDIEPDQGPPQIYLLQHQDGMVEGVFLTEDARVDHLSDYFADQQPVAGMLLSTLQRIKGGWR